MSERWNDEEQAAVGSQHPDEQGVDEERRRLLRLATAAALAGAGVPTAVRFFGGHENAADRANKAHTREAATPQQEFIGTSDAEVVGKSLAEQLASGGRITLNEKTIAAITAAWEERYGKGGTQHLGLVEGLKRMAPWRARIERIFEEEGVPRELALLAIPESHFDIGARSPAGAAGPYQFMEKTAEMAPAGLMVNEAVDERYDPLKSARACARLLKDNYHKLNKDWDLALSAYNGSFVWRYAKGKDMKERSYSDFLKYMEKSVNEVLDKRRKSEAEARKRGDTLALEALKKSNPLEDYVQNINYPAKYRGVMNVMRRERDALPAAGPIRTYKEHRTRNVERVVRQYTVKKGDTEWSIARTLKVSARTVADAIPKADNARLHAGRTLTVVVETRPNESLAEVARERNVRLEHIAELNPAIRKQDTPLPDRYVVRVAESEQSNASTHR